MPRGYLALVLHAHLPFVRHPEYEHFLEEDWLYEAITETYIPLVEMMAALDRDGVGWRLTMSVTPTLAAMLADPLLQYRYVRHLDNLIALAGKELERNRWQPRVYHLAEMYLNRFARAREVFVHEYDHDLLAAFRRFADAGRLELITCCATHGFLPLMQVTPEAVRAQVEVGAAEFARHFGRRPAGIWLAECGYAPGVDRVLADAGIRYFFTESHAVLNAEPRPACGVYAPVKCPGTGVAALARDSECGRQVWSAVEGYPGDADYREFHRDVGFELDYDYLKPHLHPIGVRTHLGIKYRRITGPTEQKDVYDPQAAFAKAQAHAAHFLECRRRQVGWLADAMNGRKPLVVAPYDAELFGHWWFEGPDWLESLFRKMHADQDDVKPVTVPEFLARHPDVQECQPVMSSWGANGYSEVWLDNSNDWVYRHLHANAERMVELARLHAGREPGPLTKRALNQAARELLLAQASDWAFIMKMNTVVEYAVQRTTVHVANFTSLYEQIRGGAIDEGWLCEIERRHNLFPAIDYRVYA